MNTKLGSIRRLLAVGGVGLAAAIALSGCGILEDAGSDTDSTDVSGDQVDAVADAAAGDCLPYEVLSDDPAVFDVDCSGADAFWSITNIVADPGLTAAGGDLTDTQAIYDTCGEEVGAYLPGKPWTDWNMIYDVTTGNVDYLFCIEALDQPNAEGKTPVTPDTGSCMSSTDTEWYQVDCADATADTTVTEAVTFDTADWAAPDVEGAAAACAGVYYELSDQFGRTSGILCVE
ncbi:hypothetical protein [Glycomyces dulcitolivorans]|uniref:hypothetical protein n=1 Tax=Glycomyces dulcitolivorans TaxID=2200759 RepID=UPI000DD2D60B|nr:hypothetical protein [Glycomyces dulcitolivorans]